MGEDVNGSNEATNRLSPDKLAVALFFSCCCCCRSSHQNKMSYKTHFVHGYFFFAVSHKNIAVARFVSQASGKNHT